MIADYQQFDGLGLAELVQRGEVTSLELVEALESAINEHDPALSAVVHRFFDQAERRIAAGLPQGPFHGVPLIVKDAGLSIAGTPLTAGSRLFEHRVCEDDDTLAGRLLAAGFVPVARSKAPEFSLSFTTEPEAFGVTRNPWAPTRSPGGSSGGAAAAVAAGLVPIAHASDGAGSIRVPAAHCGVFGFKPSRMRNPLGPRMAEGNAGMVTAHAVARSVRDSAAMLDATSGPDIGDPYAVKPPRRPFLDETGIDPVPLRIGVVLESGVATGIDPECLAAVRHAAELCASLGHHVEEATYDGGGEMLMRAWRLVSGVGIAALVDAALAPLSASEARAVVEPVNLEWIEEGRGWTGTDYVRAVGELHMTGRKLGRFFERFDILLSPVTAALPPRLGFLSGRGVTLDGFYDRFWSHAPFTAAFNASGCPAMSVPLYWTEPLPDAPDGLPVGVQFGAGPGEDGMLFALAGQLERAQPWFKRRPRAFSPGLDRDASQDAEG